MALTTRLQLLLPRTDGGVLVQVIIFTVIVGGALAAVRRDPELRLLVIGVGVLGLAFLAARSLH